MVCLAKLGLYVEWWSKTCVRTHPSSDVVRMRRTGHKTSSWRLCVVTLAALRRNCFVEFVTDWNWQLSSPPMFESFRRNTSFKSLFVVILQHFDGIPLNALAPNIATYVKFFQNCIVLFTTLPMSPRLWLPFFSHLASSVVFSAVH